MRETPAGAALDLLGHPFRAPIGDLQAQGRGTDDAIDDDWIGFDPTVGAPLAEYPGFTRLMWMTASPTYRSVGGEVLADRT